MLCNFKALELYVNPQHRIHLVMGRLIVALDIPRLFIAVPERPVVQPVDERIALEIKYPAPLIVNNPVTMVVLRIVYPFNKFIVIILIIIHY